MCCRADACLACFHAVFEPCLALHHGPQGVPLTGPVTGCGCEHYVLPNSLGATPPSLALAPPPADVTCKAAPSAAGGSGAPALIAVGFVCGFVMLLLGLFAGQVYGRRKARASAVRDGAGESKFVELS
jgi:hypothetical protein